MKATRLTPEMVLKKLYEFEKMNGDTPEGADQRAEKYKHVLCDLGILQIDHEQLRERVEEITKELMWLRRGSILLAVSFGLYLANTFWG